MNKAVSTGIRIANTRFVAGFNLRNIVRITKIPKTRFSGAYYHVNTNCSSFIVFDDSPDYKELDNFMNSQKDSVFYDEIIMESKE